MAKVNLGKIPCPAGCGDSVAVYQTDAGTLSVKCQHPDCEISAFAHKHTGAAKKWLSELPAPAPAAPAPAPAPAPAAAKKSGFGLGAL